MEGTAAVNVFELSIERESCVVARCGSSCYYDFSFTVTGFELYGDHMIELVESGCEESSRDQPREIVFFATGNQADVETGTFCRSIAAGSACETDDACREELEQCVAGTCEPRLTF